ncbi:MAG: hypothetical protein MUF20_08505, partial [Methylotetracoccus sp.]|nr:hypothetical protein [Methylotetracoccus sp.]
MAAVIRMLTPSVSVRAASRRGDPNDNLSAESCMKTLKVKAVSLTGYEIYEAGAADRHHLSDEASNQRPRPLAALGPRVQTSPSTRRGVRL